MAQSLATQPRVTPVHLGHLVGLLTAFGLCFAIVFATPATARPDPWQIPVKVVHTAALGTLDRTAFLRAGIIVHDFAKPDKNWLPGHRGIDLSPSGSLGIYAPAAGTIGFAGKVGGKPVVTLLHAGGLRSTFEPAETDLRPGTFLDAAAQVGVISSAGPWHCASACLHWGVKNGDEYLDPWRFIKPHVRIILWPGAPTQK